MILHMLSEWYPRNDASDENFSSDSATDHDIMEKSDSQFFGSFVYNANIVIIYFFYIKVQLMWFSISLVNKEHLHLFGLWEK